MDQSPPTPPPYMPPTMPEPTEVSIAPAVSTSTVQVSSAKPTNTDHLRLWTLIVNCVHFGFVILLIVGFILAVSGVLKGFSDSLGAIVVAFIILAFIGVLDMIVSVGAIVLDILFLTKRKPTGTPKVLTIASLVVIGLGFIAGPIISLITTGLQGAGNY
ncbi:MAG: hypothetical protein ABIQ04_01710 [Candidatus Saccharimonadales bacterium]